MEKDKLESDTNINGIEFTSSLITETKDTAFGNPLEKDMIRQVEVYIKEEHPNINHKNHELGINSNVQNEIKVELPEERCTRDNKYWDNDANINVLPENQRYSLPMHSGDDEAPLKTEHNPQSDTHLNHQSMESKNIKCEVEFSDASPICDKLNPKSFTCDICKKQYSQKDYFKRHVKAHSLENRFACDHCGAKFKYHHYVSKHMRLHSEERPFSCGECDATFKTLGVLRVHKRVHSEEKPFKCTMCDAKFKLRDALKVHFRKHTGERPYHCSMCESKFSLYHCWKRHILYKHTDVNIRRALMPKKPKTKKPKSDERPYSCEICSAKFREKYQLKQHSVAHSDERPFVCHICPAKFRYKGVLKQHIVRHNREMPYGCKKCNSKFTTKNHYQTHMRTFHRVIIE